MNKILKNKALVAFLSSLLLGTIITLPNIIGGHGTFTLIADWNFQQIPFNKLINDSIKEGSYLWTWFNELGSNFIGTFSFYNLFSPFNIIAYIFPSSWFEYLIGPIFILKYAVAGLTSYLFIQRYVKNKNYALIGSLLYAFSGFQLTNTLFYHFHDVVAIFPLLLYTLDSLVLDNKKGKFALVVALCALTNWFFFIGEVVFVILYFIVRVITKSYKINFNKFIQIVLESLIGTLLSAFVLLPSLLFVSSNPRINNSWDIIKMFKYENMVNYAEIIRSFIFAPEIMYIRSIFSENNYTSVELYLPFVGCILFISYILKNIRKWPSIMSIISVVFMLIPILNSSFFAFTTTYYARWFYMPILIFSLISSICLDKNYKIENGVLLSIFASSLFFISMFIYMVISKNHSIFYDISYFVLSISITFLNMFIMYYVYNIKNKKIMTIAIVIFIFLFVGIWGNYMVYKYKNRTFVTHNYYIQYLNNAKYLGKYKNEKTNSSNSCSYNFGYTSKIKNIKTFNSNISGSAFKFYNSLYYGRHVATIIEESDKYLNDFLGVRYMISCNNKENLEQYGYKYLEESGPYRIYINPEYKEFGFGVNKYISNKDFKKLSIDERKKVLNDTIVLNDKQIEKYGYLYKPDNDINYETNNFKYLKNGFKSYIISDKETLAIYTIPYDKGWKAYINGKNANIEEVDNGMMAVKINKGKNKILFKYFTPGLKEGIIITILSVISLIIYNILWDKRKVRSKK